MKLLQYLGYSLSVVFCTLATERPDIVIITRDSDYGVIYKDDSYLNDWLKQEFKQRVSQRRKIFLTHKLSVGLKIVHAAVTEEMEKAEEQLIESQNTSDDFIQDDGNFIE